MTGSSPRASKERTSGRGASSSKGTANATVPGSTRNATSARQNRPVVECCDSDKLYPVRLTSKAWRRAKLARYSEQFPRRS